MCACDDNDNSQDDFGQSSNALAFSCQNDVQTVTFKDNTQVSMRCTNYGGCDNQSKQCASVPKLETSVNNCDAGNTVCSNSIRYMCNNNNWHAFESCELGYMESTNECKPNVQPKQCTNGEKSCENGKTYTCINNIWSNETTCPNGCDDVTKACKASGCNPNNPECETECKDGESKCENGYLYQCVNKIWKAELCAKGCNGNVCASNSGSDAVADYCDGRTAMIAQPNGTMKAQSCVEGACFIAHDTKKAECCNSMYCDIDSFLYEKVDGSNERVECNPGDPVRHVCDDIFGESSLLLTAYIQYECKYNESNSTYYYEYTQAERCAPLSCDDTEGCVDHPTTVACEISDYGTYLGFCSKDEVGQTRESKERGCDESWDGQNKFFYTFYTCDCKDSCCRWTYSGDGCYDS